MDQVSALLWLLNMSDGAHDLMEIAERSEIDLRLLDYFARLLCKLDLLEVVE